MKKKECSGSKLLFVTLGTYQFTHDFSWDDLIHLERLNEEPWNTDVTHLVFLIQTYSVDGSSFSPFITVHLYLYQVRVPWRYPFGFSNLQSSKRLSILLAIHNLGTF